MTYRLYHHRDVCCWCGMTGHSSDECTKMKWRKQWVAPTSDIE
ncbi:hypothetical protein DFLDMN_001530 [Cupriavidus sp. H19C3]